jgi:hypothetical protein
MSGHLPILHQETVTKINRNINMDNKKRFTHVATATALQKQSSFSLFTIQLIQDHTINV